MQRPSALQRIVGKTQQKTCCCPAVIHSLTHLFSWTLMLPGMISHNRVFTHLLHSSPRQVSYFEIYLDKIRDLLDGEMKLHFCGQNTQQQIRKHQPKETALIGRVLVFGARKLGTMPRSDGDTASRSEPQRNDRVLWRCHGQMQT